MTLHLNGTIDNAFFHLLYFNSGGRKMSFKESIYSREMTEFHLPRYQEIPSIELYMDQVIGYIDESLNPFRIHEKEKIITSSMVNNYVKQGLVNKPVKKKYNKKHIAYIIVVCILKQILSISEICDYIKRQIETAPIETAYDYFAEKLEESLKAAFLGENTKEDGRNTEEAGIVRMATTAFADKMYLQKYLLYLNKTNKQLPE